MHPVATHERATSDRNGHARRRRRPNPPPPISNTGSRVRGFRDAIVPVKRGRKSTQCSGIMSWSYGGNELDAEPEGRSRYHVHQVTMTRDRCVLGLDRFVECVVPVHSAVSVRFFRMWALFEVAARFTDPIFM